MVPALGDRYLPSGRAYRVIVHPLSRTGGIVKVLSSPGGGVGAKEEYVVVSLYWSTQCAMINVFKGGWCDAIGIF